jgi:hypothetical protein
MGGESVELFDDDGGVIGEGGSDVVCIVVRGVGFRTGVSGVGR